MCLVSVGHRERPRVWGCGGGGGEQAADSETCREAARREGAQVHKLSAVGAPHPLVLESPQSTLEALLIVSRYRHATEPQALAHL